MKQLRGVAIAVSAALIASGCAVGPNYKRPPVVTAAAFKEQEGWKPSEPADTLARGPWWDIYHDDVLDGLESRVAISNENIASAAAAVEEARALVLQAQASFWPSLSVSTSMERTASGGASGFVIPGGGSGSAAFASGSSPRTFYTVGSTLDWGLDIWGQVRRNVENARATAQSSAAALAAAQLSAQAQLATDYFELRSQDQLQILLTDIVAADEQALKIAQARYKVGVAYRADIVTAQTQLLSAQAQQVNAGIQRATLEHAIAVLIGTQPAGFAIKPASLATSVPTVPPGVPSMLLERRPDIAEAERNMAAANAKIGVAIAAFFPSLTLSGSLDYQGSTFDKLIRASNRVWSFGPSLAETIFNGGARWAQVSQSKAAYQASVHDYRQTVLSGFQQVEDELVTLRVLEKQAVLEDELVKASREAETLTLNQYKAGTVPYSSVISAQTTRLVSEETALNVQLSRLTASVALIDALGGGWNASQLQH
ncbi:MAG TPA: efflux transporter outer membrane subunit [Steroidobacteraceae bacterium]|nr:efflux transporter outer membrane subunit [Steroidobacteraceae bacterium]